MYVSIFIHNDQEMFRYLVIEIVQSIFRFMTQAMKANDICLSSFCSMILKLFQDLINIK